MSFDHEHDVEEMNKPSTESQRDERYWLSLDQWGKDPEFQKLAEAEFQSSPLREGSDKEEGWARREFLKLMGASLALSAAGCIRRPVQKIVPYNKQPEEVVFGIYNEYTSVFTDGYEAQGIVVRTREGRPLKVEGNPNNPMNAHGVSTRGQAHILSLYDPDRAKGPVRNIQRMEKNDPKRNRTNHDAIGVKWEAADADVVKLLKEGGVAILTPSLNSPSSRAVVSDFVQAFGGRHYNFDAISNDSILQGITRSYGTTSPRLPRLRVDRAKLIVSIDGDILGTYLTPSTSQREFADGRRNPKTMNKLVAFESTYQLTGANADVRVRIKPSQQILVAMGLAHDIVVKKRASNFSGNEGLRQTLGAYANVAQELNIEPALWDRIVEDLIKNQGQSLVVAGGLATETASAVDLQVAVNFLNSALGNDGKTVDYAGGLGVVQASNGLDQLIADIEKGEIKSLIIHGSCNPVYSSSKSAELIEAFRKLKLLVSFADRTDETAWYADYVLPDNHVMEGWDDVEYAEGLYGIQQPTLRPMHDTRSYQLSLMTWANLAGRGPKRLTENQSYYDYLRAFWKEQILPKVGGGNFESAWDQALQKGVVGRLESATTSGRTFNASALTSIKKPAAQSGYELVLYPTTMFADGTLTNVSWLHELPDPVTKICWDNYACVSLKTAEKEKLKDGDIVRLTVGEKTLEIPVHVQPGLHDEVLAVPVGYGRTRTGQVGNKVGVNAFPLMTTKGQASALNVSLSKTGRRTPLATVQAHHSMEGRKIVVEATLREYLKNEAANNHNHHVWSIWGGHQFNGHKWAMAVDLNTCNGCSSCMVACQSENNIPVVGKKYVLEGREMHWLRIDRYYVGSPENAEVVFQAVMCQQCDNAPCETVCPVLATVHSSEGLNDMVYNRCVGTRYCSNNCPYKVRRFNWFNYTKKIEKPLHLALNPDVTVRSRGVMEKCTFCVHRIKYAKQMARTEQRELKDGDIKTACEQSCSAGAIVFGDMNDPNSRVSKMFKDQRAYALLEEFGAAPSVRYLTKIRNNDEETRSKDGAHQGGHA